jgi:hypothetical protein
MISYQLNWPSAVVFTVSILVIGALIYNGNHLPAAIVGAIATAIASALPAIAQDIRLEK